MSYTDATIQFPVDKLSESFVGQYLTRYTDPATGWAAAHWDNAEHTQRRQASLFNGSVKPLKIKSGTRPPMGTADTRPVIGLQISCGWPNAFLDDLSRNPQPEPELFSGIQRIN
jgi:hypothetical protein